MELILSNLYQDASTVLDVINLYQGAITALAGSVVAVFTGTLWWVNRGMVRIAREQRTDTLRAIGAAENAAVAAMNSATIAEKRLVDWERPYRYAEVSYINFRFGAEDSIIITGDSLKYKLTNHGRTPAQIIQVHATMRNRDPGPAIGTGLPAPVRYRMADVIPINQSREFTVNIINSMVNAGDMVSVDDLKKTSTIILVGYVRFFGLSDTRYLTAFCARYDVDLQQFSTFGDSRYNYTIKDDVDLDVLRHT